MREPDLVGPGVQIWRIYPWPQTSDQTAGLGTYLVTIPGLHAVWSSWVINLIHLRPVEGVPDAVKRYPEATHEIIVVAVNPDTHPPPLDPDDGPFQPLTPPDVAVQFHGVTDDEAQNLLEHLMREMVAGRLLPESDFRSQWPEAIQRWLERPNNAREQP